MSKGEHLAEFELCVIAALAQLGGDSYGAEIRKDITDRGRRIVSIGAIYATLRRLESKGLVTFYIEAARPVQGGRARKRAVLTGAGRASLKRSASLFARMLAGLTPKPS